MLDVMCKVLGIVVMQGEGGEILFYVCGFQIKNYQVDGLGMFYDLIYIFDFEMVIYDCLEILCGVEGLFFGVGEFGGMLNFVCKRFIDQFCSLFVLLVGSWNNYCVEVDIGGLLGLDGWLCGWMVGVWQDRDFFYKLFEEEKYVFYGVLEYDLMFLILLMGGVVYQYLQGNCW